jgi:uncharacterized protein YqhQ
VLRESPWRPLGTGWKILRWPFIRGSVVLLESLLNGISALNFSAKIAMADEEAKAKAAAAEPAPAAAAQPAPGELPPADKTSDWILFGTVAFALALGVGLFIALPHLAVWLGSVAVGRELSVKEFVFHLIVGGVKFGVFVGYIGLISLMKDVRRVFMYHGAEHQSIYAFEAGQALTVESARQHPPLHPRCGTTFLILVIALSILVFSLAFPLVILLVGEPTGIGWLDQGIYILIKLPLLFPIAGLAYELQRLTSRHMTSWWARALAWPGMAIQRLTTRPPTDDQLEVALTSLRKALWRERQEAAPPVAAEGQVTVFVNFQAVVSELGEAP